MKIFIALGRFVYRPQPPTPTRSAPAPFDDGLVELARLIAVDHPAKAATPPDVTAPRLEAPRLPRL